ncbi:MAG: hypothetical protein IKP47_00865 [Ruminococcus sp.]|nr:hypothetical protein [Ruminococcus sp.]
MARVRARIVDSLFLSVSEDIGGVVGRDLSARDSEIVSGNYPDIRG